MVNAIAPGHFQRHWHKICLYVNENIAKVESGGV